MRFFLVENVTNGFVLNNTCGSVSSFSLLVKIAVIVSNRSSKNELEDNFAFGWKPLIGLHFLLQF